MYIIKVNTSNGSAYLVGMEHRIGYRWITYRLSNNPKELLKTIVGEHDEEHVLISNDSFQIILPNSELNKLTFTTKTQYGKIEIKNS